VIFASCSNWATSTKHIFGPFQKGRWCLPRFIVRISQRTTDPSRTPQRLKPIPGDAIKPGRSFGFRLKSTIWESAKHNLELQFLWGFTSTRRQACEIKSVEQVEVPRRCQGPFPAGLCPHHARSRDRPRTSRLRQPNSSRTCQS
jgi:hypothetical protein